MSVPSQPSSARFMKPGKSGRSGRTLTGTPTSNSNSKGPPAPKSLYVPSPSKKTSNSPIKSSIGRISGINTNTNVRTDKIKSAMKSTVAVAPLSAPNIFQHNELNERNLTDFEIQIRDAARKKKAALDETESVMSWHTATMIKEAESEPTKMMTAFDVHSLKAAALANQRKQLKDKIVAEVFAEALPDASTYDIGAELIPIQQVDSRLTKWLKLVGLSPLSLHEAVYSGSLKHVEKALLRIYKREEEQGGAFKPRGMSSAIDFIDDKGMSALCVACKVNRKDMAFRILEDGADPDIIDALNGMSPLMYAVMADNLELVSALLSRKASANLCNFECVTPLMLACGTKSNNVAMVESIYTLSSLDVDVDTQDDKGWTALHHCVFSSSPLCITYLIEEGLPGVILEIYRRRKLFTWLFS